MKKILAALIFATTLLSCQQTETTNYDELKAEAMEVHDEIMPKMGKLMELKEQLENDKNFTEKEELMDAAEDLQTAHDDMMTWMRDYSKQFPYGEESPSTDGELETKSGELEEKVEEIKTLREETMQAISNAEELLDIK